MQFGRKVANICMPQPLVLEFREWQPLTLRPFGFCEKRT